MSTCKKKVKYNPRIGTITKLELLATFQTALLLFSHLDSFSCSALLLTEHKSQRSESGTNFFDKSRAAAKFLCIFMPSYVGFAQKSEGYVRHVQYEYECMLWFQEGGRRRSCLLCIFFLHLHDNEDLICLSNDLISLAL